MMHGRSRMDGRTLGFPRTVGIALLLLSPSLAQGQTFPESGWLTVTRSNATLFDPAGDTSQPARDIVGPAEPCAQVYTDGSFGFFRLRVAAQPATGTNFSNGMWGVEIDTGGTDAYELLAMVNGNVDQVQLWRNTTADATATPGDFAETLLHTYPVTTHARVVSDGSGHFYVDWAIPLSDIGTWNDPVRLVFGTNANASTMMVTGASGDIG